MPTDEELWGELPVRWEMWKTKGKNLIAAGWDDGVLRVTFKGNRSYRYRGVPLIEWEKLVRSPFPDRLFTTNIKGKYPVQAEDRPTKVPEPLLWES